jgi:hypothetical protein
MKIEFFNLFKMIIGRLIFIALCGITFILCDRKRKGIAILLKSFRPTGGKLFSGKEEMIKLVLVI